MTRPRLGFGGAGLVPPGTGSRANPATTPGSKASRAGTAKRPDFFAQTSAGVVGRSRRAGRMAARRWQEETAESKLWDFHPVAASRKHRVLWEKATHMTGKKGRKSKTLAFPYAGSFVFWCPAAWRRNGNKNSRREEVPGKTKDTPSRPKACLRTRAEGIFQSATGLETEGKRR